MEIRMEVKLLNTEKGELKKEGSMYTVYYKPLAYKQSSEITLEISDIQLKDTSARAGCMSCTTTNLKSDTVNNKALLTINYDTKNIGNFDKRVNFFNNSTATVFRLVGTVSFYKKQNKRPKIIMLFIAKFKTIRPE